MSNELKSLDEQLAELCGLEVIDITPPFTLQGLSQCYKLPDGSLLAIPSWQPTTDLNQLKMCYGALKWDEKIKLTPELYRMYLASGFTGNESPSFGVEWMLRMMLKHPELVAQAILAAKGVS